MRHTKHLPKLGKSAIYRLDKIYKDIGIDSKSSQLGVCVIESQTLLYNFFRAYFISCMVGCRSSNGTFFQHVSCPITARDAIDPYMRLTRPKRYIPNWTERDEPPWHKPDTLLDALNRLSNPAFSFVVTAFGASYNVFSAIIPIRNFYAHRNQSTIREAKGVGAIYSLPTNLHPNILLVTAPLGDTSIIIENWYFEIYDTINYLCL